MAPEGILEKKIFKPKTRETYIEKNRILKKGTSIDMGLLELVFHALSKHELATIKKFLDSKEDQEIEHALPLVSNSAQKHLGKMIYEQIIMQFSEKNRPLIELLTNAIDSKNKDNFKINIEIRNGFHIKDNGRGMDLEGLLKYLVLPFSRKNLNKKNSNETIGSHGIGFYSALKYCFENPREANLIVSSFNGDNSYRLKFYYIGEKREDGKIQKGDIEKLRCQITKCDKNTKGTTIDITGINLNTREVKKYLWENCKHLGNEIPILVNGKKIQKLVKKKKPRKKLKIKINFREMFRNLRGNGPSLKYRLKRLRENLRGKKELKIEEFDIELDGQTKKIKIGLEQVSKNGKLTLLVDGGVGAIIDIEIYGLSGIVYLPKGIRTTQGRDDVIQDDNFKKSINEILKAINKKAKEIKEDKLLYQKEKDEKLNKLRDSAAQLCDAFNISPSGMVDKTPELIDDNVLFLHGTNVYCPDVNKFFGKRMVIFRPKTKAGTRLENVLISGEALLFTITHEGAQESLKIVEEERQDIHSNFSTKIGEEIRKSLSNISDTDARKNNMRYGNMGFKFLKIKRGGLPFLIIKRKNNETNIILVNVEHPLIKNEINKIREMILMQIFNTTLNSKMEEED